MAADRARVADGDWIAEGVVRPLAEAPKLLHLPNDVVIVCAGKASYVTPANEEVSPVDLAVAAAGDAAGPAEAANAVRHVFDTHADAVRAHVGAGVFPCPQMLTTAYTVAAVTGRGANGPVATLAALTERGPCAVQTLFDSVAFAPAVGQPAVSAAVYAAASTPSLPRLRICSSQVFVALPSTPRTSSASTSTSPRSARAPSPSPKLSAGQRNILPADPPSVRRQSCAQVESHLPVQDMTGELFSVGTTPEDLAHELQVSATEIRRFLRAKHPRSEAAKHERWDLDDRLADAVRHNFRSR